jgi:hypothetical protein
MEARWLEFIDEHGGGPGVRLKKSIKGKGRKQGWPTAIWRNEPKFLNDYMGCVEERPRGAGAGLF